MKISSHAEKRQQQRAIPAFVLELLEFCGSVHRCGGAEKLFFDKAAKKRLKHRLGGERGYRIVEPWLRTYAVVGDNGNIITLAHASKRLRNH